MEGTQIGPYRVLGDLGSGGMGKVYLAEVAEKTPGFDVGIKVSLKVIHPHLLEAPGFFKRFLERPRSASPFHRAIMEAWESVDPERAKRVVGEQGGERE